MADHGGRKTRMIPLSIIIPTYNRSERLRVCLEALATQTQSASDFEVIVVNDGGTDDTEKMISSLSVPYALKVIRQSNQGQNVARNYGVKVAQGRYCLFLDDDIIAEPELVAAHLKLHREQEEVIGIGQMTIHYSGTSNWFINTYTKGWRQHYQELNQGIRKPAWPDCYAGNISIPRSIFLEVGGFATDIRRNHDVELGYRLQQYGVEFVYVPAAIGRQDERKQVHELISDLEKAGAAWITLCQRHPGMYPELFGSMTHGLRESILLEIVWRLGISPRALALLGGLFEYTSWSRKWFRFINQYCRWRGVRRATSGQQRSNSLIQGTPILMYHAFAKSGEAAGRFVQPIHRFTQQMNWLKRLGYCVLSLDEFLQYRHTRSLPPERSVVITIDDGYAELRNLIYPILQRNGFHATIFLVTDKVGEHNDWASTNELRGRPLLSCAEIREMARNGIQFGAHSRTHARLMTVSPEQLLDEVAGSKANLEAVLQLPVTNFAYPYGEFDSTVQAIVEQANFLCGCSADSGLNTQMSPIYALHRIEIEGTYSLPRFLLALWVGSTS